VSTSPIGAVAVRAGAASIAGLVLALVLAVPASADAELVSSTPADDAVVTAPVAEVELRFDGGLAAGKSAFRLLGPEGEIGTGSLNRDGGRVIALGGLGLGPGEYTVKWTIGSADGHVVRGTLRFSVEAPTPAPVTPTTAPPDGASPSAGAASPASASPPASEGPASAPPSPAPGATESPAASGTPGAGEPVASSGADVVIPIVAALLLVAGIGAVVLRRGRGA
jgi:methionine-rich copper-binding protein CopC